jgi:RimJ/RimL family protein N-acetyltransferase
MFLHTKRLLIRNFTDADLESFLAYRNEPEVAEYQGWSLPYPREKAKAFIAERKGIHAPVQGEWQQFALELKETGEMFGDVGFCINKGDAQQATIGFTIASAFWKKGYATEALSALLGLLFEDIDLHRVVADCDAENIGSWKTLEKLGFRREAHFVESFYQGGQYRSEYLYGMLWHEWRARKGN